MSIRLMERDVDIRQRILDTARGQFFSFGFTKVSIDQIAARMGMSKKTIYRHFPSKEDLVQGVIATTLQEVENVCREIIENSDLDFVEKLRMMMSHAAFHISKMGRPLIDDLEKNVPHVWREISNFRSKRIKEDFGRLLEEGVQKGFLRSDIDQELTLLIYNNLIENIVSPEVLTQLPFTASQVYDTIIKIIFEGIMTKKFSRKHNSRRRNSTHSEKDSANVSRTVVRQ